MPTKSYLEAIREGMRDEMRRDERVMILGEDVGAGDEAALNVADDAGDMAESAGSCGLRDVLLRIGLDWSLRLWGFRQSCKGRRALCGESLYSEFLR